MRMEGPMRVCRSILLSWDGRKRTLSGELITYAGSQRRDAHSDGRRDDAMARTKAQRKKSNGRCNPSKTANTDATFHDGKRRREGGGVCRRKHYTDGKEQGDTPPRPPRTREGSTKRKSDEA